MSNLRLMVDRDQELLLLSKVLRCDLPHQVVNICEGGGKGKSFLLKAFRKQCREVALLCSLVEFKINQALDPVDLMSEIVRHLGEDKFADFNRLNSELNNSYPLVQIGGGQGTSEVSFDGSFNEADVSGISGRDNISIESIKIIAKERTIERKQYIERVLTNEFIHELNNLRQTKTVVLMFDAYEHCLDSTNTWLQENLLNPIHENVSPNIMLVFAGRPEGTRVQFTNYHEWQNILLEVGLEEFERQHVKTYFLDKLNLTLDEGDINSYFRVCKHDPLIMGLLGNNLLNSNV